MARDFKEVARKASEAGRIKNAISEAAAEETPKTEETEITLKTQETPKTEETPKTQKKAKTKRGPGRPRKRPADAEETPRINLLLSQELYNYIRTIAGARRESMNDLINEIIESNMAENKKIYEKAKNILNEFKR